MEDEPMDVWLNVSKIGDNGYIVVMISDVIGKPFDIFTKQLTPTVDNHYVLMQAMHFFTTLSLEAYVREILADAYFPINLMIHD
jgi:hypothetical protein